MENNKKILALLGLVLVVIVTIAILFYYSKNNIIAPGSENGYNSNENSDESTNYVPELKKIDQSGTNQENPDGASNTAPPETSSNSGSYDASLDENKNATSTYENINQHNFDEKK